MTNYCRTNVLSATWFVTVNLAERKENKLLIEHIDELRKACRDVKDSDCRWMLPPDDADFSVK